MTSLEPGWNISFPAKIAIRGQDQWNVRSTMRGIVEIESVEGANGAVVDALMYKGDTGDAGRDGRPPIIHAVPLAEDVPSLGSLDESWIGHGWRVGSSRDVTFLTQSGPDGPLVLENQPNWLGAQGNPGAVPSLAIGTVTAGASPTDFGVSIDLVSGTSYEVNMKLPLGLPGEDSTVPGPTATIATASDAEGLAAAAVGDVLYKKSATKFGAKKILMSPGVYKKAATAEDWQTIDTGSNWKDEYVSITTMVIPAQPTPWEPEVFGLCEFQVAGSNVRMDLEARLGAISGPLLSRGPGPTISSFVGEWSSRQLLPAAEESTLPTSSSTIVAADTAVTIYLIARKIGSTSGIRFQARKDRGYLRVRPMPMSV